MHVERIRRLADHLESLPDTHQLSMSRIVETGSFASTFNMHRFVHPCGTAACIGGWAVNQMLCDVGLKRKVINQHEKVAHTAQLYLGLDLEKANELFAPRNDHASYRETNAEGYKFITAKRAATVLRHLADTGEVDWSATEEVDETVVAIDELIAEVNATTPEPEPVPA